QKPPASKISHASQTGATDSSTVQNCQGEDVGEGTLSVELVSGSEIQHALVPISVLVIAGWTGRDRAAVEEHIAELEKLGVKRPLSIPTFYPVSSARLTTRSRMEALGAESSGE